MGMDKMLELLDLTTKPVLEEMVVKTEMIRRLKVRRSQQVESLPILAPLKVMLEVALELVEEIKTYLNNSSSPRTKRLMYSTFPQLLPSKAELRTMMMVKIKRKEQHKLRNRRTDLNYLEMPTLFQIRFCII